MHCIKNRPTNVKHRLLLDHFVTFKNQSGIKIGQHWVVVLFFWLFVLLHVNILCMYDCVRLLQARLDKEEFEEELKELQERLNTMKRQIPDVKQSETLTQVLTFYLDLEKKQLRLKG